MSFEVVITEPNLLALAYISMNLRAEDADEIYAGAITGPDMLAGETMRTGGVHWIAWVDNTPVASFGGHQAWPGVWNIWMWATDNWPKVALSVTRHIKRVMIPELVRRGAHRGQCASAVGHTTAHAWLESLGLKSEGVLSGYGRQQQDFLMYAWRKQ